jgi:hypothetical protein
MIFTVNFFKLRIVKMFLFLPSGTNFGRKKIVLHSFNCLDSQRFGLKEVVPSFPQLAITNENRLHYSVVAIAYKLFDKMCRPGLNSQVLPLPMRLTFAFENISAGVHDTASPDSSSVAAPKFPPRWSSLFQGKIIHFCILISQSFPQCSNTIGM